MAENFMQWSEELPLLKDKPPQARQWLTEAIRPVEVEEDFDYRAEWDGSPASILAPWRNNEFANPDFSAEIEGDVLWVYSELSGDLHATVTLIREFLKKWGDGTEVYSIQYSVSCSKPRVGEFGGGVVSFSRDEEEWEGTNETREHTEAIVKGEEGPLTEPESATLLALVRRLQRQALPVEFELIATNDGEHSLLTPEQIDGLSKKLVRGTGPGKVRLQTFLERQIASYVQELRETASEIDEDCDNTFDAVSKMIWERGSPPQLADASKACGALSALFHLAQAFEIDLSPETMALKIWAETISPIGG